MKSSLIYWLRGVQWCPFVIDCDLCYEVRLSGFDHCINLVDQFCWLLFLYCRPVHSIVARRSPLSLQENWRIWRQTHAQIDDTNFLKIIEYTPANPLAANLTHVYWCSNWGTLRDILCVQKHQIHLWRIFEYINYHILFNLKINKQYLQYFILKKN